LVKIALKQIKQTEDLFKKLLMNSMFLGTFLDQACGSVTISQTRFSATLLFLVASSSSESWWSPVFSIEGLGRTNTSSRLKPAKKGKKRLNS
jgi:hypothetical protein